MVIVIKSEGDQIIVHGFYIRIHGNGSFYRSGSACVGSKLILGSDVDIVYIKVDGIAVFAHKAIEQRTDRSAHNVAILGDLQSVFVEGTVNFQVCRLYTEDGWLPCAPVATATGGKVHTHIL